MSRFEWESNGQLEIQILGKCSEALCLCSALAQLRLLSPFTFHLLCEKRGEGGGGERRAKVAESWVLEQRKMVAAAAAKVSYEECRRKRLEENQKRMESLNLPQLAQSLRRSSSLSPSPSPMKQAKPRRTVEKQVVVVRRSGRVANMPAPVYKETFSLHSRVVVDRISTPRRIYKRREPISIVFASNEGREYAIEKAKELESTLQLQYPTLVKSMLPSHVSGCFWLGLPVHFCKTSLPKNDGMITLVDEEGEEFPTVYLARKTGLSGGWKGFSVAHELNDGDALVFQVIQPTVLKVHIIRVSSYDEGEKF
ncbi:B3 domain-containing protein At5g42700 isoform X2 [Punica granatum]|uniref:B3 domain-containing protein At5g42700 isoform X2 n=1 Tax=Punica granatum TaxID=22663 RepID=A0A6P8BZN7_PUNGR|nr:B3 domain-containing protein At5g42700 isoform X2 [Punica granatum]